MSNSVPASGTLAGALLYIRRLVRRLKRGPGCGLPGAAPGPLPGSRRWITLLVPFIVLWTLFALLAVRRTLFDDPFSTVLFDRQGILLDAHIAADEQWRFPPVAKAPLKFEKCIVLFEDGNFYRHRGVDVGAVARALYLNLKHGRIVSGASTLTMQVIRLSRKGKPRVISEKLSEAWLAFCLELSENKQAILALYASHAPFGGNIVGIAAAAWRYFGRLPEDLSWAEAAWLAVLPNDPNLPGTKEGRSLLRMKRDALLYRLCGQGLLSAGERDLACAERLPETPYPVPRQASHLLVRAMKEGHAGQRIHSSLDAGLQQRVAAVIAKQHKAFAAAQIHNAAALVVKIDTGEVLAYVGNTAARPGLDKGNAVDIITAKRSTGSLLKPFLYAFLLDEGELLPGEIVPDIPLYFKEFNPQNPNHTFQGIIPVNQALSRSLNVPFVYLLKQYNYQKFYDRLAGIGLAFGESAGFYGLSLVIGGADNTLWNLTGAYASLARVLKNYPLRSVYHYTQADYFPHTYLAPAPAEAATRAAPGSKTAQPPLSAAAIWYTFKAMLEVARPGEDVQWERFASSCHIAWKTGTSYGNRDAWAIGFSRDYLVGVWVGNADSEGRPEIKGSQAAGPILFDIFTGLPVVPWYAYPAGDFKTITVCRKSGQPASPDCPDVVEQDVPAKGAQHLPCMYHRIIHLDALGRYRVESSYYPVSAMRHESWFLLSPVEEYYYKRVSSTYQPAPPFMRREEQVMDFIYPSLADTKIFVPIELDGTPGKCVFEVVHRNPGTILHWHLDGEYWGTTRSIHQMGFNPQPGSHALAVIDEQGEVLTRNFTVVPRQVRQP